MELKQKTWFHFEKINSSVAKFIAGEVSRPLPPVKWQLPVAGVKATQSSSSIAQRQKLIFYGTKNFPMRHQASKSFCKSSNGLKWILLFKRALKVIFCWLNFFQQCSLGAEACKNYVFLSKLFKLFWCFKFVWDGFCALKERSKVIFCWLHCFRLCSIEKLSSLNRFLFTIAVLFFRLLIFVKVALSLLLVDLSGLSSASLRIKGLLISWLESSIWPDRSGRSTSFHSSFEYDGWWKPGLSFSQPDASPSSGSQTNFRIPSFPYPNQSRRTFCFVMYLSLNKRCPNGSVVFRSHLIKLLSSYAFSAILLTQTICNWCLSVLNLMFSLSLDHRFPMSFWKFHGSIWLGPIFLVPFADLFVCPLAKKNRIQFWFNRPKLLYWCSSKYIFER